MTARPIIFNGAMVRAILDGAKTQTRRVVKPCKDKNMGISLTACELAGEINQGDFTNSFYGQLGDRLWVRETFQRAGGNTGYWYAATDSKSDDGNSPVSHWKPSIHMPREASRITLEISGMRVERLQDITADDSYEEGTAEWASANPPMDSDGQPDKFRNIVLAYRALWESINGAGSWEANPWVWVVEFKRVEVEAA